MSLLIRNFTGYKPRAKRLEEVVRSVLDEERFKAEAEVSLVLVGEKRIRNLNRQYRGIGRVTDVLSFEGENDDDFISPKDGVSYLGEIFICVKKAERQAREHGHPLGREMDILMVHGMFHLMGYDHIKDEDYEVMHRKEDKALRRLSA